MQVGRTDGDEVERANQVADVLARLDRAEERDPARGARQCFASRGDLGLRWHVEDVEVDAVIGHGDGVLLRVHPPQQLVFGGSARHDAGSSATNREPRPGREEPALHRAVHFGHGEECRIVKRHDHGDSSRERHRVVRGKDDVRTNLCSETRQPGLLPGEAERARTSRAGRRDDRDSRSRPRDPLDIARLAHDAELRALFGQSRQQPFEIPANATTIGGDGRRVHEDVGRSAQREGSLGSSAALTASGNQ